MTRRAVDFANFTDVPTAEQVRCWMTQGYTTAIIGTSFPEDDSTLWKEQTAACEASGMDVQHYVFPDRFSASRNFWLDCETPAATVDLIRKNCQAVGPDWPEPRLIGIYTRRQWWVDNTGDWDIKAEFPWLKLWDASYGDPPPAFVPYGGFTERAIHQWHDSTDLCGLNVDLNIIEEEPDMEFTAQNKQDIADIVRIEVLKALGTLPDGNGDQYKRNMEDLAHAGSQQTVDAMVKAGQVKPPQP